MIECLTDFNVIEKQNVSCNPCPVDAPTCDPHVPTCNPRLP